jgi:preprotein translocase subunit SecE
VARNRKRAKERRARRPQPVGTSRGGREETPDPIAHAAPDVELAEAQLAYGRPDEPEPDDIADEEEFELEVDESIAGAGGGGGPRFGGGGADGDSGAGDLALPPAARESGPGHLPAQRVGLLARLVGFVQGSWRELQRVQWPDRRQVVQATSVVVGFVIVAGVFLGVADLLAQKLMKFILG